MKASNQEYDKYIRALEDRELLSNVYMFRIPEQKKHVSVVVLNNGNCYSYASVCSDKDQYVKRIGRNIATGRALKIACWASDVPGVTYNDPPRLRHYKIFYVDPVFSGNALRDELRRRLGLPLFHEATFTAS